MKIQVKLDLANIHCNHLQMNEIYLMNSNWRGFRLSQRSHLQTLKNFVSEKSRKRCENSGKHCEKSKKHCEKSGEH